MMKICFCIDTMESGGAERVASVLCNEFIKEAHKVDIVMISEKTNHTFYDIDDRIKLIPLLEGSKRHNNSFIRKVMKLKTIFKKCDYDVVISFLPNVNTCVWLAAPKKRKFIHIVSERNNPFIDPKNRFKRKLKEIAFKHSDGVVCQTKDASNYYHNIKNKVRVINNPLFELLINERNNKTTNNDIVSVGRLEEQKNFELLIKAFSIFSTAHPESRLKIYGSGSLKNSLNVLICSLKLNDKIILCGNSNDWISENMNCALFINSSLYEGMPNSLLEALANKMPCIASDCPIGGSRELLSYDNGLLFNNNDLDDLVKKMELLYHNDVLIEQFSKQNENIKKMYSAHNIAKQWVDYAKEILNGKNKV